MQKNIPTLRKSEKNEKELENHKNQLFLNKKRKTESENSSTKAVSLFSPNHGHSSDTQWNTYKTNFLNNFRPDMDPEVIDITGESEKKQNPISFINLMLENDNNVCKDHNPLINFK